MSDVDAFEALTIDPRFNGPPESANGGYAAGALAQHLDGIVEVTLRSPPPLGRALRIDPDGASSLRLVDGDRVVAQARGIDALAVGAVPALDTAQAARCSAHYRGFEQHLFPTCFVCGPQRAAGDGLRIFPGRCANARQERASVACTWSPDSSLSNAVGIVAVPFVWSALDCPGYFAVAEPHEAAVLGRMALDLRELPKAGETYVVVGWAIGREGRKLEAGTALLGSDGRILARARQTWIALRAETAAG